MADSQLYADDFNITALNNQKYDRVSRISGTSTDSTTIMTLDINSEIYPISPGETINLMLASTLNLDGSKDEREKGFREMANEASLADSFDYVCYGKVYRFEGGEGENIKVYVSFGGLLLYIEGPYKKLTPLRVDYVYLLIKR